MNSSHSNPRPSRYNTSLLVVCQALGQSEQLVSTKVFENGEGNAREPPHQQMQVLLVRLFSLSSRLDHMSIQTEPVLWESVRCVVRSSFSQQGRASHVSKIKYMIWERYSLGNPSAIGSSTCLHSFYHKHREESSYPGLSNNHSSMATVRMPMLSGMP